MVTSASLRTCSTDDVIDDAARPRASCLPKPEPYTLLSASMCVVPDCCQLHELSALGLGSCGGLVGG